MKQELADFLAGFDGKPVTWGTDDCTAVCARWVREAKGIDITGARYSSREEAHALIAAAGGLVNLWDEAIGGSLVERFGAPELGDVAVIPTRTFGPVGVICAAGGVCAWRKDGGFFWLAPRSFLKVWALS